MDDGLELAGRRGLPSQWIPADYVNLCWPRGTGIFGRSRRARLWDCADGTVSSVENGPKTRSTWRRGMGYAGGIHDVHEIVGRVGEHEGGVVQAVLAVAGVLLLRRRQPNRLLHLVDGRLVAGEADERRRKVVQPGAQHRRQRLSPVGAPWPQPDQGLSLVKSHWTVCVPRGRSVVA